MSSEGHNAGASNNHHHNNNNNNNNHNHHPKTGEPELDAMTIPLDSPPDHNHREAMAHNEVPHHGQPPPAPRRAESVSGIDEHRKPALLERCLCSCAPLALRLVLCGASASFLFGFNLSLLNTSLNIIAADYHWCDIQADNGCTAATLYKAFISTAVFIGAACGAMTSGRFLAIGRRMLLLLCMVVFVVGIVASCASNSFSALMVARLIVGYGVGVVSVAVPVYMSEMSPKEKRGSYGVFHQLFITVGIFIGVLLGMPLSSFPAEGDDDYLTFEISTFDKIWWRVMLGLGLLPVAVVTYLLVCAFNFDTPHFYVEKEKHSDARKLLKQLREIDDPSEELNDIIKATHEARASKEAGLDFRTAFRIPVYRHVILVGCVLAAFQQLGGINVFVASSNSLFDDAGVDANLLTTMSTVLTLVNLLMTFPSIWLIERMGRRPLMCMGCIGMTISVLPGCISLWVNEDAKWAAWVACGGAIGFIIFFATSYGPVLWVYLFEIYPAEIKGVASGLATAVNWVAGIAMVFVSNFVATRVNYTIFAAMSGISIFIVFAFMKETKGKSLQTSPFMTDKQGRPIKVDAHGHIELA